MRWLPRLAQAAARERSQAAAVDSDEWYTPPEFIALVRQVLGDIDLDPASCEVAQTVVQAHAYFTAETDGLAHPWPGRVFLNPPYSRGLVDRFAAKFAGARAAEGMTAGITLVNACLETQWIQPLTKLPNCWPKGRMKFWNPLKPASGKAARQPQIVFYDGPEPERFEAVFKTIGKVWLP